VTKLLAVRYLLLIKFAENHDVNITAVTLYTNITGQSEACVEIQRETDINELQQGIFVLPYSW
jgi:hypothetical protein